MAYFSCEHPRKITNPYNGETLFVPCGECFICKSKKAATWTERLEVERASHPYTLFGTLTYSDKYLPRFDYLDEGLCNLDTGEFVPYSELNEFLDDDSINFINSRGFLPVGSVQDCQRFIKRLRETVRRGTLSGIKESCDRPSNRYIRYFLVEELGETTFRPHYHFLIFTSSKWFADHAKVIVASCWSTDNRYSDSEKLGIIDCQNVQSSASAYVAQYINSFTDCPSVYRWRGFRPFKIFSKAPPLGSLMQRTKEISELFSRGSVKVHMYERKTNKIVELPLPKSIYNRLYPKIVGFDRFPSHVVRGLYQQADNVKGLSFQEFGEYVRKRAFNVFDGVSQYFVWLLNNATDKESNLHSVFGTLRRIGFQSEQFKISSSSYYDKIVEFYKNLDLDRLNSQCKYLEDSSKYQSLSMQLLTDLVFLDRVSTSELSNLTKHDLLILKSYGYDENTLSLSDFLEEVDFTKDREYIDTLSKSKKIVLDSRKKKAKNEYLEHRRKDKTFINFLIDYHKNGLSKYNEGVS